MRKIRLFDMYQLSTKPYKINCPDACMFLDVLIKLIVKYSLKLGCRGTCRCRQPDKCQAYAYVCHTAVVALQMVLTWVDNY